MFSKRGPKGGVDSGRFANRLQKVAGETVTDPQNRTPFVTRTDRRKADVARIRMFVPGTIVQTSGDRHPVVVANISDAGAELRSMRALGVLRNFQLLVPSHAVKRSARVAWRSEGVFGVEFVD